MVLVQPLTSYDPRDTYGGALQNPPNRDTCSQLRSEKWMACHSQGEKIAIPSCTIDMKADQLTELHNRHMTCHNFRALENSSYCFDKSDKGHMKAQRVQLEKTEYCKLLLSRVESLELNPDTIKSSPLLYPSQPVVKKSTVISLPKRSLYQQLYSPVKTPIQQLVAEIESSAQASSYEPVYSPPELPERIREEPVSEQAEAVQPDYILPNFDIPPPPKKSKYSFWKWVFYGIAIVACFCFMYWVLGII